MSSPYPLGVPAGASVLAYRPEARELIIERELPRDGAIPAEQEVRVVKGEVRTVPRKPAEARHLYGQLLARIALRTLAEVFANTPATVVDSVVLNGRVTAVDRATGKVINPHLLSVQFLREAFQELNLDAPELDPELCLRAQNALISPHPHDLVPVKPLMYYDLDRYKTIAGTDFLVDLDSRLDLLTLTPNEFENLIRQLFEARGLKSWQTQASRDDGIDAVAVNEDPVLGGLAIIQAKRYSKVVGYESVTALAGVMHDKAAARGILVTTSWVGKASREFAHRNGRMQIIEGRELKQMLAEALNMDVLISLRSSRPARNAPRSPDRRTPGSRTGHGRLPCGPPRASAQHRATVSAGRPRQAVARPVLEGSYTVGNARSTSVVHASREGPGHAGRRMSFRSAHQETWCPQPDTIRTLQCQLRLRAVGCISGPCGGAADTGTGRATWSSAAG